MYQSWAGTPHAPPKRGNYPGLGRKWPAIPKRATFGPPYLFWEDTYPLITRTCLRTPFLGLLEYTPHTCPYRAPRGPDSRNTERSMQKHTMLAGKAWALRDMYVHYVCAYVCVYACVYAQPPCPHYLSFRLNCHAYACTPAHMCLLVWMRLSKHTPSYAWLPACCTPLPPHLH